ncbi:hypothetical protein LPA44_11335 [Halobacterium sp. KA-4]|uniref:hypothetical protein n=1 Tax=Halobacterium sp. KA-4 TaxID=2896367 RepID=UPI001E5DEA32|nr:hypothetical protein [Halobacterium sp. KA-4]MCD2200485.1 hypothetical protein [Halobacterium sp. KA-4]
MYNLSNALTLLRNPQALPGVYHQFGMTLNQRYYKWRGHSDHGSIMDESWDNLFLLDGCRYDLFKSTIDLDGTLEPRISVGSSSNDFLTSTFTGEQYHDTVYVTANPYFTEIPDETFYTTINLLDDGWDVELETVPPDVMADAIRDAHKEYPQKRILAHFMQPHYPFIGEFGQQLPQGGISPPSEKGGEGESNGDIWVKLQFRLDGVTKSDVWRGYRENLERVVNEVEQLILDLDGQTVLSSDHGNLIGDWIGPVPCRGYGHPPQIYADSLVRVPWFVIPGQRREVVAETPVSTTDLDEDIVSDRLNQLGYIA